MTNLQKKRFEYQHAPHYDAREVANVIVDRLEEDGYTVSVEEFRKEAPSTSMMGGSNVFQPHAIKISVTSESFMPNIVEEEIEEIAGKRYSAMKNGWVTNPNATYIIVIKGVRAYCSERVAFKSISHYQCTVTTVYKMPSGRTLEQTSIETFKTRSKRFKDFRQFLNREEERGHFEEYRHLYEM